MTAGIFDVVLICRAANNLAIARFLDALDGWHTEAGLVDTVLASVKKGAHVLIEGSLVSSTYEKAQWREAHLVVDSGRRRAQARPGRTRAGRASRAR